MRELIRGYAAAAFETARDAGRLDQVGAELTSFFGVLNGSDDLRNALSDAALTPEVRRDVVIDLVESKVAPETAALLSFTVRYERAGELLSTLTASLYLVDLAAQTDFVESLEPQATHGATRERVRGYAERVLQELAAVAAVDEVEDELFRIARLLDDNAKLRKILADVNNAYDARAAIASDLLVASVQPATMRIVAYVLRAGRFRDLVGTFDWLVELAAAERGRRVGEVRSAVDLDAAERQRLAEALGRLVERTVEIRVIHDPNVIGGMLVSVGDLVIDGTVRNRFERLRDLLAQAS